MPEAQPLALLRTNIDRKSRNLKRVLMEPQIRKHFLKGVAHDEKKAIKAFAAQNAENALKTRPKVRVHLFPKQWPCDTVGYGSSGSLGLCSRCSPC